MQDNVFAMRLAETECIGAMNLWTGLRREDGREGMVIRRGGIERNGFPARQG